MRLNWRESGTNHPRHNYVWKRMMVDFVEHYANLALKPGWIDYVRHQVREMEKHPMFKGLGKAVAQRIKELNVSCDI